MKLHNKKTGLIIDFEEISGYSLYDCGDKIILGKNSEEPVYGYTTLKEFNEDWEDYNPKEPLIKDEKIRKAVKVWAEVNYIHDVNFRDDGVSAFIGGDYEQISFNPWRQSGLEDGKLYTIEELCGEEEE